jgi:hypothetical protein
MDPNYDIIVNALKSSANGLLILQHFPQLTLLGQTEFDYKSLGTVETIAKGEYNPTESNVISPIISIEYSAPSFSVEYIPENICQWVEVGFAHNGIQITYQIVKAGWIYDSRDDGYMMNMSDPKMVGGRGRIFKLHLFVDVIPEIDDKYWAFLAPSKNTDDFRIGYIGGSMLNMTQVPATGRVIVIGKYTGSKYTKKSILLHAQRNNINVIFMEDLNRSRSSSYYVEEPCEPPDTPPPTIPVERQVWLDFMSWPSMFMKWMVSLIPYAPNRTI